MLAIPEFEILLSRRGANRPAVSIITTVYDRLDCLTRCIHSVQALNFKEYEHIIVADGPARPILEKIEALVADNDCQSQRTAVVALKSRRGDWGITPSAVGLSLGEAGTSASCRTTMDICPRISTGFSPFSKTIRS
jgi:glycosyltransferase involved in cell wall biosynthesis